MTPAAGGEVEDLLEPVWSWPERTMLAFFIGEGMPGSRAAATPQVGEPRGVEPEPPPPPGLSRRSVVTSLRRASPASRPQPLRGGLRPALTPAPGTARVPTQEPGPPRDPINPTNPQQPLDTAPLLQGCRSAVNQKTNLMTSAR